MATPITRALYEALLAEQEVYSKQIEAIQQEIARVNQDILLFKNTIADSPALISQNQAAQDTNQKLQADTNTAIADKQNHNRS
jgi:predicted  nucleic acid-binding Zn-ribbon protein